MYKDIINYELAEGVSEGHLLEVSKKVVENWMTKQEGFIKWEIHKNNDGHYTDIVFWYSKENAKKAEESMKNNPNANEWYACFKHGSISSQNIHKIGEFL